MSDDNDLFALADGLVVGGLANNSEEGVKKHEEGKVDLSSGGGDGGKSLPFPLAAATVPEYGSISYSMHIIIREKVKEELETVDFITDEYFDKPDESIQFGESLQIPILGKDKSGRQSLMEQWVNGRFNPNNIYSDNHQYGSVIVHERAKNAQIFRNGHGGQSSEVFNKNRIEEQQYKNFILCVDMTEEKCSEFINEQLSMIIEKRKDFRLFSVVIAGTKCDEFIIIHHKQQHSEVTVENYAVTINDPLLQNTIKDNIRDLEDLTQHYRSKHDLSVIFIPTSAKWNWNVRSVFEACIAQWMSVHEFEYLEAKRVQQELSKDAALDCCMNPLVLALYDAVTIIVSLADISTDLWVLIHWYSLGRWTPFYISLTILCLAQMSYITAFLIRFCDNGNWSWKMKPRRSYQKSIWILILFLIPISPLLSFIMYFASLKDSCFANWMDDIGFEIDDPTPRKHASKIERFLVEKLFKHFGFLLEAGVEAFPQSILQMAVMVSYSETNWVSVVSILLSLISVCTKSLVFSYALELRTMLFNYLSLCLDFISIFALISWIFYNPNGNGITTLGQVFLYRIALTTVPFVTIAGFFVATLVSFDDWSYQRRYGTHPYRNLCKRMAVYYTMWVIGTPFMILGTEVACCAGLAFIMFMVFSVRFGGYAAATIFWGHVFSFVNDGHSWEDRKLRCVLVIEAIINAQSLSDDPLIQYIKDSRQQTYSNVTWSGLRKNTRDPEEASLIGIPLKMQREAWKGHYNNTRYLFDCQEFRREINSQYFKYSDLCIDVLSWPIGIFCVYFAMPIYVCSRFFSFSFVWIAFATTDFQKIDHLQLGMAGLLGSLQLIWLAALIMALRLHFVTWHIGAGHPSISIQCANEERAFVLLKRITDLHDAHTTEPERRKVILEHFGPDIASVVLDYMPTLIYDIGETVG